MCVVDAGDQGAGAGGGEGFPPGPRQVPHRHPQGVRGVSATLHYTCDCDYANPVTFLIYKILHEKYPSGRNSK